MRKERAQKLRERLDELYRRYNDRTWIGTDPVQFVHRYGQDRDRELVGLIASSLAYGNVRYIHASIERVLSRIGEQPFDFLMHAGDRRLQKACEGFRHRWTDEHALFALLAGARDMIAAHGSLAGGFMAVDQDGADLHESLGRWVSAFRRKRECPLLADPGRGSACKRLYLYLRWMVRKDEIDAGCWTFVSPSRLRIPLDTHMYQFARRHRFTGRKALDFRTVTDITGRFAAICPEDPVRYDFALTRPGIAGGPLHEL